MAKRHHQPDIHRETRDRLKDLIGNTADVQEQKPNHPFKEVIGTYYNLLTYTTNNMTNSIIIQRLSLTSMRITKRK